MSSCHKERQAAAILCLGTELHSLAGWLSTFAGMLRTALRCQSLLLCSHLNRGSGCSRRGGFSELCCLRLGLLQQRLHILQLPRHHLHARCAQHTVLLDWLVQFSTAETGWLKMRSAASDLAAELLQSITDKATHMLCRLLLLCQVPLL